VPPSLREATTAATASADRAVPADRSRAAHRADGRVEAIPSCARSRTTYGDGQVTVPLMLLNIPDEPSSVGTFANVAVTVAPETVATSWPPVA